MFYSYLVIAFRNLQRQKFYAALNIIGLSLGITSFLFVLLFIRDELNYDRFNENADNIYRMNFKGSINGSDLNEALSPFPMGATLVSDFPEVINSVRIFSFVNQLVRYEEDEPFIDEKLMFADAELFSVFSFEMLKGNQKTALSRPNTLVISKTIAEKYYKNINPIGKTIRLQHNDADYEITGVFEDMPLNSHFRYDIIASFITLDESKSTTWFGFNCSTYILVQEDGDIERLEAKFPGLIETYMGPEAEEVFGKSMEDMKTDGMQIGFFIIPLTDIHLYSPSEQHYQLGENGDIRYVYIFSIIGVFILVIAGINFINLSTARSMCRAKEVGLRKVIGADKAELVKQFLLESILVTLVSTVVALIAVPVFIPLFNELSGKSLYLSYLLDAYMAIGLFAVVFIVGLVAGLYPAFYLAAFKPIDVLKNILHVEKRGQFRNGLVIVQFSITIVLIISTLVVFNQLEFIQQKKLGYEKDRVLLIEETQFLEDHIQTFKETLLTFPEIQAASISSYLPIRSARSANAFFPGRDIDPEKMSIVQNWQVDHDYITTMKMQLAEGRDFQGSMKSDSSSIILNQAAVKLFNLEDPLGKEISYLYGPSPDEVKVFKVIGVVKNFHFETMREAIGPLVMYLGEANGMITTKINGKDLQSVIAKIEEVWYDFVPSQTFKYSFLDQKFNTEYQSDQRVGKIIGLFSTLTVVIACLGLLGLVAYTVERRNREIGIRKVMGATVGNVIGLLTKNFFRLIIFSFVLAAPVAWYFMVDWLSGFEYRIVLEPTVFLIAGLGALAIAGLTVIFQSYKAATMNPTDAIRNE